MLAPVYKVASVHGNRWMAAESGEGERAVLPAPCDLNKTA